MSDSPDKRSTSRFLPIFELRVREQDSGRDLGLLVDASPGGLRIASPVDMEAGTTIRLSIEAGTEESASTVECNATVRWSRSNPAHPGLHVIGLQLSKFGCTDSEHEHLKMLLAECIQAA